MLSFMLRGLLVALMPCVALATAGQETDIVTEYPEKRPVLATNASEGPPVLAVADYIGKCEPSANGLGIGSCSHGLKLSVSNAPRNVQTGEYLCTVSWMLERPDRQSEILEFDVKVQVPLVGGVGSARHEVKRDLEAEDDFEEDPLGLMRSDTSCVPVNY